MREFLLDANDNARACSITARKQFCVFTEITSGTKQRNNIYVWSQTIIPHIFFFLCFYKLYKGIIKKNNYTNEYLFSPDTRRVPLFFLQRRQDFIEQFLSYQSTVTYEIIPTPTYYIILLCDYSITLFAGCVSYSLCK